MIAKLAGITIFSLIVLMIIPVHADVITAKIEPDVFTIDDKFTLSGTVDDTERLMMVAAMKGPNGEKLNKNIRTNQDGTYSFIPVDAQFIFQSKGEYTITVFTEKQRLEEGIVINLQYSNSGIAILPDYILELEKIGNKNIDESKELSFTASVTDSEIDVEYSIEKQPTGAVINKDTGVFTWIPDYTQSGVYVLEIIVKSGILEDKETIAITVNDKSEPVTTQTTPVEPTVTTPTEPPVTTPTEPPVTESLEIPASFVDATKDPQSYVDRYNNEASYKKWFDDNYSEYSSIYEAVGLEEPKGLASFVDATKDPQSYVDRYNNEASYKKWFDDNYSEYSSIYEAVGLEEPKIIEPEFGECGEGTDLIDGTCMIIGNSNGGGCLIATATYGSEMAPQIQTLREIRDNQLMSTSYGVSFMTGFNQLYYSFSPIVADMERENPMFKEAVKITITPLLSSLSIMSYAESESEVLGYGIGVILANIGMYIAIPAIIIFKTRKYIKI